MILPPLSRLFHFEGTAVRDAIRATFERRGTALPAKRPPGLTKTFARDKQKMTHWTAFRQRESLFFDPGDLVDVVRVVNFFVTAPAKAARTGSSFTHKWKAGGPWRAPRTTTTSKAAPRKPKPKKTKAKRRQASR